ncbi:hypothetical protein [Microaerobacter geothermalis]|nr:hypothetical protein [Microaerobacter geothermalis]
MERTVLEVEPYIQSSNFTEEDLETILGARVWMYNLLMIIEQHPMYNGL